MKRLLSALLAAACLLGFFALPASALELPVSYNYTAGQFCDVGIAAWYTPYVAAVYELGLMQGNTAGAFCPGANVTLAESAALAARLHQLYHTGNADFQQGSPWYQVYVDYAKENGILQKDYRDYNAAAKRSEFAAMLARAFPEDALNAINTVPDGRIPDVPMSMEQAAEIYSLYRAGVLTGSDEYGTFAPGSAIHRSEVAAIVARMARPELRKNLALKVHYDYPDLAQHSRKDDTFFADAAMLGNSLVDGMMLCSGIKLDYYGGTGLTVYNNKLSSLLQKQYGKVYIEFGINEIGGTVEGFVAQYRSIVNKIHETYPDTQIYIMAITPVTKSRSDGGTFTMKKIKSFNDELYKLAEETGCWYLDVCTPLCDSTGYLPTKFGGWDGSPHLDASGYVAWADVIRTYYAE